MSQRRQSQAGAGFDFSILVAELSLLHSETPGNPQIHALFDFPLPVTTVQ
jgi:hypothetical protein